MRKAWQRSFRSFASRLQYAACVCPSQRELGRGLPDQPSNQPIDRVADRVRSAEKVGMFTSEEYPPNRVAEYLISRGLDYFSAHMFARTWDRPMNGVTRGFLSEISKQSFGH